MLTNKIYKGELLLEENFYHFAIASGDENKFLAQVEITKHFGDVSIRMIALGKAYNPLSDISKVPEDEREQYSQAILKAHKDDISYARKNDANIVCGNLKRINSDNEILKNPNYKLDYSSYFTEYYLVRPKHYGLPWDFQKNIFKKDFIIKNNIGFPDLKIGSDVLFLVDFLTSIQEIYIIPIDLYGYDYTINGNYKDKFKNYQMKHDYIVHFKILLEILDYYKFKKNANKLKKIFIGDLNTSIKNKDTEFYKIFNEIFDNTKTLSNYKDELLYFDLFFSTLILRNGKIVENFYKTKEKLKEINLDSNLPKKLLLEVEFILSCKNFEDYKLNIDEFIKSIDN